VWAQADRRVQVSVCMDMLVLCKACLLHVDVDGVQLEQPHRWLCK
jgi:hypothetical protein